MSEKAEFCRISADVVLGRNVTYHGFVNLYGCSIGDDTQLGAFVEIQRNARVGARCKISSHTFICEGVQIADECFIGHGVAFINDRDPWATDDEGRLLERDDWTCEPTYVERRASIGSGATILSGVRIGTGALVGAGSVVTRDVPPATIVAGVPARVVGERKPYRSR